MGCAPSSIASAASSSKGFPPLPADYVPQLFLTPTTFTPPSRFLPLSCPLVSASAVGAATQTNATSLLIGPPPVETDRHFRSSRLPTSFTACVCVSLCSIEASYLFSTLCIYQGNKMEMSISRIYSEFTFHFTSVYQRTVQFYSWCMSRAGKILNSFFSYLPIFSFHSIGIILTVVTGS